MAHEIVMALYKPKQGQAEALEALVQRHEPLLRQEGLVTDRPFVRMRSAIDGTVVEIFEWTSADGAHKAHQNEAVGALWGEMVQVASLVTPAELQESTRTFPHFEPMDG